MRPVIVHCAFIMEPLDPLRDAKGRATAVGSSQDWLWLVDAQALAGVWPAEDAVWADESFDHACAERVGQAVAFTEESLGAAGQARLGKRERSPSHAQIDWQERGQFTPAHVIAHGPLWALGFDARGRTASEALREEPVGSLLAAAFKEGLERAFGGAARPMDLLHDEPPQSHPRYPKWARARDEWFSWWGGRDYEPPSQWRKGANPLRENLALLEAQLLSSEAERGRQEAQEAQEAQKAGDAPAREIRSGRPAPRL